MLMTKFPGGGLEYGEGPVECLQRECREEMGFDIKVTGHFYTTDFFQKALFFEDTQLISIYYTFEIPLNAHLSTSQKPYDFSNYEGAQSFRWAPLKTLKPDDLTFPIDQKVTEMVLENPSASSGTKG